MSATKNFLADLTDAKVGALRSATAIGRVLTMAAATSALTAGGAAAGPKGGEVKAGAATITTRGGATTINQSGQKVVIDWKSFDIDANEAVNFIQPSKDSIALNRVLNDLPTHIRGQLTANGNVWIVNQHGVTFHAGAMVNVGSLIATTADISNADFMAGNYKFDKPGDPNAKIINEGDITFGEAGLAAFVAPSAANHGVIAGRMGKVVIAGAETFAVDLAGDGMWAFTMGEGANAASASNSGRIHNPGGYILISARAAQGMVDSNISVGGIVEATSAKVEGGKIVLSGDGFVEVSGTLAATGTEAGQVGGSIEITGDKVHVHSTANIDASGDAGGGSIKIGGDYQGGGALETASRTLVSEGAEISASAIGQVGDGGEVIVWADEITGFFGSIRATGGAHAGDGGFAEVSGKQQLAFDGWVDLSATNGLTGELLLDPDDILIVDGAGANDTELLDFTILAVDPGATFTISNTAIETALASSNVIIEANNTITQNMDAAIDFTSSPNNLSLNTTTGAILLQSTIDGGAGGLALNAGGSITVDAAITTAGALNFDAGQSIILNSAITSTAGDVSLSADTSPTGTVNFGSAVDGVNIDVTTTAAVALGDISATGSLTVIADGAMTQTAAASSGGVADFTTSGDSVDLSQANMFASVTVDTTKDAAAVADVTITEADGVSLGAITAASLTVTSGGTITQTAAASATGLATFNTSGDEVVLTQGGNAFGSVSADTAFTGMITGDVSITEVDTIDLAAIDADALTVNAGGDITDVTGALIQTDGATSLTAPDDINIDELGVHDFAGVVTLSADQIVDFSTTGGVTFGAITATNATGVTNTVSSDTGVTAFNGTVTTGATSDFRIRAGGSVTQTGSIATDRLTLTPSAGATFALTGANDVASLAVGTTLGLAGSVAFTDTNGVDLAGVSAGALTIVAADAITDSAPIIITNEASLTSTGIDLTLDQAGNSFGSLSLDAANVSVLNLADLTLGTVDLSGGLTVNVTGGVTQGATSVAVDGTTSITAVGDIALASPLNEFTGEVTLSGEDISIANASTVTLTLGGVTASTNMPADTVLTGDGDVTVAGGAIRFNGALTGVNDLTVDASGMVSQSAAITVAGDLDVNAAGQTVLLNNGFERFSG